MGVNLQFFLDVIVFACGIYMIYGAIKLKTKKIIDERFLLPKSVDKSQCKDIDGYIKYMFPKYMLSASIMTLGGLMGIVNDKVYSFGQLYFIIFIIVLFALGFLMVTSTKALRLFFK